MNNGEDFMHYAAAALEELREVYKGPGTMEEKRKRGTQLTDKFIREMYEKGFYTRQECQRLGEEILPAREKFQRVPWPEKNGAPGPLFGG